MLKLKNKKIGEVQSRGIIYIVLITFCLIMIIPIHYFVSSNGKNKINTDQEKLNEIGRQKNIPLLGKEAIISFSDFKSRYNYMANKLKLPKKFRIKYSKSDLNGNMSIEFTKQIGASWYINHENKVTTIYAVGIGDGSDSTAIYILGNFFSVIYASDLNLEVNDVSNIYSKLVDLSKENYNPNDFFSSKYEQNNNLYTFSKSKELGLNLHIIKQSSRI